MVPALAKKFFVINNIDKESGLINLSYSGNPANFIDCGRIKSYVKNARGERTYDFPAARDHQVYEVMDEHGLWFADRTMTLEGRINLIFEKVGPNSTRVTANTRYVVVRSVTAQKAGTRIPLTAAYTINFDSGSGANFPANAKGIGVRCIATGDLEKEVLSLIK